MWSELKACQDANSNGIVDAGELMSFSSLGIAELSLSYDDGTDFGYLDNDIHAVGGSKLLGSA